ncbi:transposase [Sphingomonas melonis]|uniref:transposase n=2 Tax=Sphingomonas melonis TaxID=152682 RepID=UPI0009F439B6|nr:transposase [Sphingomonas melonis]
MALFWLSDEAWAAIEPHLPKNQPDARRVDDRRVISGIVHVLKVGCRGCDCPAGDCQEFCAGGHRMEWKGPSIWQSTRTFWTSFWLVVTRRSCLQRTVCSTS